MTPTEFRQILHTLGWSNAVLANKVGLHKVTVRNMGLGKRSIDGPLAAWMREINDYMAKHPPPKLEKKKRPYGRLP